MAAILPENEESLHKSGQQAILNDDLYIPFIEFEAPMRDDGTGVMVTGYEGLTGYEITPKSGRFATVRVNDTAAIKAILLGLEVAVPTTIPRIDFPDVLAGVAITYNSSTGSGSDSHPASQQSFEIFGSASGQLNPSSNSQGSAAIMPDVTPDIRQRYHVNVPAMEYTFYMDPSGTPSMADVLARLSTMVGSAVTAWPQFHPEPVIIKCLGQQASVSAKADTRVFAGGTLDNGAGGYEWGNGTSEEVGITVKSVTISPTIHEAFTFTGSASDTADATASADATTDTFAPGFALEQPAITNSPSVTKTITGSVTPDSVSATAGDSTIPSTGHRLYSINPGPLEYGMVVFQAIVVDMSTLT